HVSSAWEPMWTRWTCCSVVNPWVSPLWVTATSAGKGGKRFCRLWMTSAVAALVRWHQGRHRSARPAGAAFRWPPSLIHRRNMMTIPSNVANFNGAAPVIDPDDAVMLLIDHQSGLFQTVKDMPMTTLRDHAAALAKIATLSKLPVITTASVPQGPNGPLIPEIHQNAPHAQYVARKGEINAWHNEDFVAAVKATGRKTLIIAGTITSVCMAFPAISAVAEGYKVFVVIDASGTYSKMAEEITLARMMQAGVVPIDT